MAPRQKPRPEDDPLAPAGLVVPPSLLALLTFLWYAIVAVAHYREFFTHR